MSDDSLLGQLAEEFTRRVREGKLPDIEEYANRCPELAGRIRELFPTLILLEGAAALKQNASSERTSSKALQPESPQAGTLPQRQRFVAGDVLTGRYRIISLLGKGGMGEVYRAEDLKLAQSVALKFLPESLASDGAALARLYREVSIARQVSHPNVCRVYDIGEMDAEHFLSMEYIDGEDLASLLRRIGRLPADKAIDIGCQLCAGLASIHETGVLHRDIKPANIIIDGRGRARITDFGLASVADQLREISRAGTPAYMAPEQLQGGKLTQKVDIYALGHVLYEMFTGKRAGAEDGEGLGGTQDRREPTPPSAIVKDMDPRIERVILRCLEENPQDRPSAKETATALAGKDLIGEALAAGETPSPEMLAAAGSKDGWRPWLAWACLAFVILGIGATIALSRQYYLYHRLPLEKPPQVLVERAREILRKGGYPEAPVDSAFGFETDDDYFQYVRNHNQSSSRWDWLPDSALQFWYRQSPSILAREEMIQNSIFPIVGVSYYDPQPSISGEASVWLDGRGRLIDLEVLPPEVDKPAGIPQTPDWSILFREAGLDPVKWTAAEPTWTPMGYADTRAAWQGTFPERPEIAMRVEAAAYRGKPVFWRLIGPWATPSRTAPEPSSTGPKASEILGVSLIAVFVIGGALIARRNLRRGRGDRHGAGRLAFSVFALMAIAWIFSEHHVPAASGEFYLIIMFAGSALLISSLLWLLYVALEPLVRRRWPVSLISWSRLLGGRFRDPLVGQALLIGCVVGVVQILLDHLKFRIPAWIGSAPPELDSGGMELYAVARAIIPVICSGLIMCILYSFFLLFFLFLLRVLLRRQWAATVAFIMILATIAALHSESPLLGGIFSALRWGVCLLVLVRFGFLATATGIFASWMLGAFPITTQLSAWYSGIGFSGAALVLIMAIYAFHTSLAGRPLLGRASLED